MPTIRVTKYNLCWPVVFARLRDRIWPAIAEHAERIEHVGSTSVIGLAAKPIIDMTIVTSHASSIATIISVLARHGYRHRGDLGVRGREAFHSPADLPEHHLYLCVDGGPALRNHLAVRDCLRANPEAVKAYAQLKLDLAKRFPHDIESYIAAKTPMLLNILEKAGLAADDLSEIKKINTGK